MILSPGHLRRRIALAASTLPLLGIAVACGGDDGGGGTAADAPYVVATTGIWADITGLVACDDTFSIRTLVPAGGDAHSYEPSLRDRETLDGAALVVANGLGLEELLGDTIDDVEADGVTVVRMADHVPGHLEGGEHAHDEEDHAEEADHDEEADHEDDGHDHGGDDPHVWFDPTRVAAALPTLGDALVEAGAARDATDECLAAADTTLAELDATVAETLSAVPAGRRTLVTNHDALGYFADRYDFEILGSVLPSTSTLGEANQADLDALGREIEEAGVPAIFTESLDGSGDAETLAGRLGVEVVELYTDALGEPGSGADTYAGLLTTDATAIATALG